VSFNLNFMDVADIKGYYFKFRMQDVNLMTYEWSHKAYFFESVSAFKLYAGDPVVPVFGS
jgi:hypothetical protein